MTGVTIPTAARPGEGGHARGSWRWRPPAQTWARRLVLGLGLGGAAAALLRGLAKPSGDLRNHLESGRRLLAGEALSADGLNFVYPPAWALAWAPWSRLPQPLVHLVLSTVALALALLVVALVEDLDGEDRSAGERFWIGALGLALASPFLVRDLADAGPNLLLLGLVWGGIGLWAREHDLLGGALLGVATALKCTPALFLAYFAWKRQWRVLAAGAAATALATLAPAAVMGWSRFASTFTSWAERVGSGLGDFDPRGGVLATADVVNVALRPALGIPLAEVMAPQRAGLAILALQGALLVGLAWTARHRLGDRRGAVAWELAAVAIAALLLSPITWKQHCVATLPALVLLVGRAISPGGIRWTAFLPLALFAALVLPLRSDLLGEARMAAVDRLGIKTIALLLLLTALLLESTRANVPPPRDARPTRAGIG